MNEDELLDKIDALLDVPREEVDLLALGDSYRAYQNRWKDVCQDLGIQVLNPQVMVSGDRLNITMTFSVLNRKSADRLLLVLENLERRWRNSARSDIVVDPNQLTLFDTEGIGYK